MIASRSTHIELESVPLRVLCKQEPGSLGLYVPQKDSEGKTAMSIARISSQAKAMTSKNNKKCVIQQVMLIERSLGSDVPAPLCMIQITITEREHLTARGERYLKANEKRALPAKPHLETIELGEEGSVNEQL
ncbi:hypothetical protein ACT3R7_11705 [Halomonas sp. AOP43-A1-21]